MNGAARSSLSMTMLACLQGSHSRKPISHPMVPDPLDPQEDPVEEEDRSGQRLLFGRVDRDVGVNMVFPAPSTPSMPTPTVL